MNNQHEHITMNDWEVEEDILEDQEQDESDSESEAEEENLEEEDFAKRWDTEAGWFHENVHSTPLNEVRKWGYPNTAYSPRGEEYGSGERPLGNTGLRDTPTGLAMIWSDLAATWHISKARLHRITTCHGICILAKDPLFIEMESLYRPIRMGIRGTTDFNTINEVEASSLIYHFSPSRIKKGGSIGYLTNRLGIVSEMEDIIGVSQATMLMELSIISIMTLEGKLGRWKNTVRGEYNRFRKHMGKRKKNLEELSKLIEKRHNKNKE